MRGGETVAVGKQAPLAPTLSGLQVGDVGQLDGQRFAVLGRVRFGYDGGHWDEWRIRFNDNRELWLSEDEGEFCLEEPLKPLSSPRHISEVALGDPIQFKDWSASVDEKDTATCVGFEGELPEEYAVGDSHAYAEGANEKGRMFTLEEDGDGVSAFAGRIVSISDMIKSNNRISSPWK